MDWSYQFCVSVGGVVWQMKFIETAKAVEIMHRDIWNIIRHSNDALIQYDDDCRQEPMTNWWCYYLMLANRKEGKDIMSDFSKAVENKDAMKIDCVMFFPTPAFL